MKQCYRSDLAFYLVYIASFNFNIFPRKMAHQTHRWETNVLQLKFYITRRFQENIKNVSILHLTWDQYLRLLGSQQGETSCASSDIVYVFLTRTKCPTHVPQPLDPCPGKGAGSHTRRLAKKGREWARSGVHVPVVRARSSCSLVDTSRRPKRRLG